MWANSHKTTGLITCTKEILNRHLKFLCSASSSQSLYHKIKYWVQRFPTLLIFAISQKTLCGPARKVSFINFLETLPYDIKAFLTNSFILKGPTTIWSTQSYSNLQDFPGKKNRPIYLPGYFLCISQQITFSTFPNTYLFAKDAFYWRFLESGSQSPCGQKFIQNEILTN